MRTGTVFRRVTLGWIVSAIRFSAGAAGYWRVRSIAAIIGETLPPATHLARGAVAPSECWALDGIPSNQRYTIRAELNALRPVSPPLGRAEATCAALIPIRKSAAWWDLAQDERRAIFEERSRHTTIGLAYLPRIARQLLHSRDREGPFDFLTWFEFAPAHEAAFDDMVGQMRASEEWSYVEREVDIRLVANVVPRRP